MDGKVLNLEQWLESNKDTCAWIDSETQAYVGRHTKSHPGCSREFYKSGQCVCQEYANPFRKGVGEIKSSADAFQAYLQWVREPEQAGFRHRAVEDLRGKQLVCNCKSDPKYCHALILYNLVNEGDESFTSNATTASGADSDTPCVEYYDEEELKMLEEDTSGVGKRLLESGGDMASILYYRGIQLSEEQAEAVDWIVTHPETSVFITGPAGTGKSVVLRKLIEGLHEKDLSEEIEKYRAQTEDKLNFVSIGGLLYESFAVTASTGLAAWSLGGQTLHSYAGLPVESGESLATKDARAYVRMLQSRRAETYVKLLSVKRIIVDEVSMLDGRLLDFFDRMMRELKQCPERAFGGVQMVFCGDFLQLPPVNQDKEYGGGDTVFAFDSEVWSRLRGVPKSFVLTKIFRQSKDPLYMDLLSTARFGQLSQEHDKILRERLVFQHDVSDNIVPTILYSTNKKADERNENETAKLDGSTEQLYRARITGSLKYSQMLMNKGGLIQRELRLRVGSQVMLIVNCKPKQGLMNGSKGVVTGFTESTVNQFRMPIVDFGNSIGQHILLNYHWQVKRKSRTVAEIVQLPVMLAWACTIHKSQGMSLSKVELALNEVFEANQGYVALSRVTQLSGLRLLSYRRESVFADPRCIWFMHQLYEQCNKTDPHLERAVLTVDEAAMKTMDAPTVYVSSYFQQQNNNNVSGKKRTASEQQQQQQQQHMSFTALEVELFPPNNYYQLQEELYGTVAVDASSSSCTHQEWYQSTEPLEEDDEQEPNTSQVTALMQSILAVALSDKTRAISVGYGCV